ncbi:hypothetical protein ACFLXD_05495 [Chloroflexota bacterium]
MGFCEREKEPGDPRYGILRKRRRTGPGTGQKIQTKGRDVQGIAETKRRRRSLHGAARNEHATSNTPKVVRRLMMTYHGMRRDKLNRRPLIGKDG